jgi:dethiobiotin synthetase
VTPAFVIAGTGTEVGKTHVACALLRAARARELSVAASKPVMSGADESRLAESDAGLLLAAAGDEPTDAAVAAMAPWRFSAPLAPTAAARAEGRALPYADVLAFCRGRKTLRVGLHLIETAGGVMSPIAEAATCLDLAADLGLPVVLVADSYLGAVSHTLTALAALGARGVSVAAVVVNETRAERLAAVDVIGELAPFAPGAPLIAWAHGRLAPPPALLAALGLAVM